MTINSTINRKEYEGNGETTSFPFPYYLLAASDLKVYQNGTLKTLTTYYTLSGSAPWTSGTNVQFVIAPAPGDEIVILRDPVAVQTLDLVENDALPAEELERAYDRLTMLIQRLSERADRAFRLTDTDVSGASLEVPTPVAQAAIGWNSSGTALVNLTTLTGATGVTDFMRGLLEDEDADAALSTLGFSTFIKALIDDADAAAARDTLGVSLPLAIESGGTSATDAAAAFTAIKQAATSAASGAVELSTDTEAQTHTDTTRAITPSNLAAVILGFGQSYQDMTSSRASGVTYTNSTGRTIAVSAWSTTGGITNQRAECYVDGVRVAYNSFYSNASGYSSFAYFLVPPGVTYSITFTNAGVSTKWYELR